MQTRARKKNPAPQLGRRASLVAERIRELITAGSVEPGQFIPSERELAREHGVNKKTIRRILNELRADSMIEVIPRHGYRVISPAQKTPQRVVAYVSIEDFEHDSHTRQAWRLNQALQKAVTRRGWSFLTVGSANRNDADIAAELTSRHVSSVIFDSHTVKYIDAVRKAGIRSVMVDDWAQDLGMDSIMQDGQLGGMLAARHLASKGCKRIAWFGPDISQSATSTDRFCGFAGGIIQSGLELRRNMIATGSNDRLVADAKALLSRMPGPDGIAALWFQYTTAIAVAAEDLGLREGHDYHMVGWCVDMIEDTSFRAVFGRNPVPPMITWNTKDMAELAVSILAAEIDRDTVTPARINVPVKLMPGSPAS